MLSLSRGLACIIIETHPVHSAWLRPKKPIAFFVSFLIFTLSCQGCLIYLSCVHSTALPLAISPWTGVFYVWVEEA